MAQSEENVYSTDKSSEAVTTGVTICSLTDDDGNLLELHDMNEPIAVSEIYCASHSHPQKTKDVAVMV